MPRTSNTEVRRYEITKGLMSVMAEVGYEGATIPLIAGAAGLTPGLIHYHFKSKQEILIELINHLNELVGERFKKLSAGAKGAKLLDSFIRAHVGLGDGADPRAVACWVSVGAEAVRNAEIRAVYQKVASEQIGVLEKACEAALVEMKRSTRKKREIALGISCAIEGAYRLMLSAPDLAVPGFAVPTITQMAHGLLLAQTEIKDNKKK